MSEPKRDEGSPSIPAIITTVITIAGFGFLYLTQFKTLSLLAQFLFAGTILLAILLFLVWIWYRPLAHYWSERASDKREDRISRLNAETLQVFIEKLQGFATSGRMDSVVYPLIYLRGNPPFAKATDFNPWIGYVNALCSKLLESLRVREVNRINFIWTVDTFTLLVNLFNDNLFRIVQETLNIAEQTPLPKGVSGDYNTNRQTYTRFLTDYPAFVADMNKRFRTHVVSYGGNLGSTTLTAFQPIFFVNMPKEL